ncbi:hypothetical protein ERO13_D02G171050v2 [Gossypium hirsutum]|uniref:Uncharacterized protein n=4 Tax=Gossypium TaxID=3633 RepID=A0A5J5SFD9_GOSBA|nr:hypothetical protein ES319_D02G197300v1 [Gossypium barbadense]KAG4159355.1 hypothetical protein ERO13_D02G171050v2 [Gossypium hirsutum]TYG80388.1 hypothetical protein ES288_D02G212400v1 [Gossypium darwinii]TYH84718.1 hypothetical protein ES332_D02G215500v1 [Gossypium tomentosum]TYI94412.1 hypothetical protein E1A91_D02G202400v1 [Gossypium mustelinum]
MAKQWLTEWRAEIRKKLDGIINTKVNPLTEQNQTMAPSTYLSTLSYASNPPKPISTKTVVVITNSTSLSYSLALYKLIYNKSSFFFKPDPKNLLLHYSPQASQSNSITIN